MLPSQRWAWRHNEPRPKTYRVWVCIGCGFESDTDPSSSHYGKPENRGKCPTCGCETWRERRRKEGGAVTFKLGEVAPVAVPMPASRCARKIAHPTREEAQAQLDSMVEAGIGDPHQLVVYLCDDCLRFHVGHDRRKERDMTDVQDALKHGGVVALFLGTGYDTPTDYAYHPQVRSILANTLVPARIISELANHNVRAAILSDQIDHKIYLTLHGELKRRKIPYLLRKSKADIAASLALIFPPPVPAATEAVSVPPPPAPPPVASEPVLAPPNAPATLSSGKPQPKGAVKAFVEEWWHVLPPSVSAAEGAQILLRKATEEGLQTTVGSLEQAVRVRRRAEARVAGVPASTATEILDDVIEGLEKLRAYVAEMEGKYTEVKARAEERDEAVRQLAEIRRVLLGKEGG